MWHPIIINRICFIHSYITFTSMNHVSELCLTPFQKLYLHINGKQECIVSRPMYGVSLSLRSVHKYFL